MSSLAHKIRYGVMELRTDIGLAYARPTFWQRIYLLWTFRNFHRLPKEVLNRRQQKLIDKLCWSETVSRHALTTRTSARRWSGEAPARINTSFPQVSYRNCPMDSE